MCGLTGHRADPAKARWNRGICFGECTRCRRAVVRSATGSWRVPRGFRVVWREVPGTAEAPQDVDSREPEIEVAFEREQLRESAHISLEEKPTSCGEGPLEELHAAEETAAEGRDREEGTGLFEWPLVAAPASAIQTYVEPIAEIVLVAPNPEPEEPRFAVEDFMDEQDDDLDWSDLRDRQ